jgi:benzodiazapine receptor
MVGIRRSGYPFPVTLTDTRAERTSPTEPNPWVALLVFTVAVGAVSFVGNLATMSGMDGWFQDLDKPSWQPPDAVFGPVWAGLYVLIIASGWLVWREVGVSRALVPWAVQLVLNAGWSIVFFGLESPNWAVVEIVLLVAAIAWTMVTFWPIHRLAALLLVPYLAWVGFATALTISIASMN